MATQWLSAGINPKVASERLGHANVAFTLQVYGHVLPHDEMTAAQEMAAQVIPKWAAEGPKNPVIRRDGA